MASRSHRRRNVAPEGPATLEFAGPVEFWLTRKRIKNVNIRIKPPDGRVEVSAPVRMSIDKVREFVEGKADWIEKARASVADAPSSLAERATDAEKAEWRAVVEACTPALIAAWEPIIGVSCKKLAYRNMKSRWGSCQPSTGRICINTRLALYPPECLEYVVVHELCHLVERGHGPAFRALMDTYMPDWKERRGKLR